MHGIRDHWGESLRLAAENFHGSGGYLLEQYEYPTNDHCLSDIMKKRIVLPDGEVVVLTSIGCWMKEEDLNVLSNAYSAIAFDRNVEPLDQKNLNLWRHFINEFVRIEFPDFLEILNFWTSLPHPLGQKKLLILSDILRAFGSRRAGDDDAFLSYLHQQVEPATYVLSRFAEGVRSDFLSRPNAGVSLMMKKEKPGPLNFYSWNDKSRNDTSSFFQAIKDFPCSHHLF